MLEVIDMNRSISQVKTERDLPPHLAFEEFKQIYYGIDNPLDKILCALLWETGGRISDVLNLRWKHIDIDKRMIQLYVDKRDITIQIPITDFLSSDIKTHKMYNNPLNDALIFASNSKRFGRWTRQAVDKKIKIWGKKLGKNLHAHMWRHGIAIYLLAQGVNIKVISARLGHSNVFTTMNYYMVITPELQRELTKHIPMR